MANQVLRRIRQIGSEVGASPIEVKAAIETGIVESNLENLPGGDRDSAGWRQERKSIYKDPTNLDASIRRFFNETRAVKHKYATAGELAAAVQRPAAQYRGRYQQVAGRAASLMGGSTGAGSSGSGEPNSSAPAVAIPAAFDAAGSKQALLQQYLAQRGRPGAIQGLYAGLTGVRSAAIANDSARTAATLANAHRADAPAAGVSGGASGIAAQLAARANTIDAKRLPYKWGGGHGGKVDPSRAQPLDCSGAVSAVLGINPRVSGDFAKWGRPGENGTVTVYSNSKHVLMKINGHFFGTSASNPGGGAGWIPRSQISRDYLKGFTARSIG